MGREFQDKARAVRSADHADARQIDGLLDRMQPLEHRLFRQLSVYASVRNLMATPKRNGILAPGAADYTTYNYYQFTGALFTFGIKGSF